MFKFWIHYCHTKTMNWINKWKQIRSKFLTDWNKVQLTSTYLFLSFFLKNYILCDECTAIYLENSLMTNMKKIHFLFSECLINRNIKKKTLEKEFHSKILSQGAFMLLQTFANSSWENQRLTRQRTIKRKPPLWSNVIFWTISLDSKIRSCFSIDFSNSNEFKLLCKTNIPKIKPLNFVGSIFRIFLKLIFFSFEVR